MKHVILITAVTGLLFANVKAQETVIFQESFETDGHNARYTVSSSGGFSRTANDHFNRTDGSNISNVSGAYSGFLGRYFFAAEDTDDDGGDGSDEQTIVISGIDISGYTNLSISGLFAAGVDDGTNVSAYDANDYLQLNYSIDSGSETSGIHFRSERLGGDFNEPIGLDADFDGEADNTDGTNRLVTIMERYSVDVPDTGSTMTITIRVSMDAFAEQIAFDNIQVIGTQSSKTTIFQEGFETDGHNSRYTVSSSGGFSFSSNAHFNRTDGSNITGGYSGFLGQFFFAAENTDRVDGSAEQTIVISGIDISGYTNLQISGLFGAGNEGGIDAGGYDDTDYVQVNYSIDSGGEQNGIHFRSEIGSDSFNDPIGLDADYSGDADSTDGTNRLGATLERYSVDVPGTGSTMTITIRVSMDAAGEEVAFDNIQVFGTQGTQSSKTISVTGSENWRLISAPLTSMTFDDLLSDVWTQGFTGADATSGTSNVYSYDETITTGDLNDGFTSITDQSATMTQGLGYAVYVYSDDNGPVVSGDAGFPKSLTFSGSSPTADVGPVSVTFTTSGTASNDGWNLMGNPFASDLNVGLMGIEDDANIDNFAYVYSASTSSYLTLDAAAADSSTDQIAMGQGFFLKASSATTYTFPFASVGDGATFQKSVSPVKRRDLAFTLSDSNRTARATIRFHTNATNEKDPYDGYYLRPFGNDILGLFSVMDSESFVYNAFPYQIDGELSIPMDYITSEPESLTLEWGNLSVFPSEWQFTLIDNYEGSQVDLRSTSEYTFEGLVSVSSSEVNIDSNLEPVVFKAVNKESRFTLLISQTTVSNEEEVTVEQFALDQNYPNPFNPTTSIRYTVPNSGLVNVSIYNVMGQKVATLVNTTQSAGTYTATWNAARSASGIYYYRLEAGGQTLTRKMTLIK